MKLLIDSANIEDIKHVHSLSCFEGVTTNPTILFREKCNIKKRIKEISEITKEVIFVQIIGKNEIDLFSNFEDIKNFTQTNSINFVVKVPINSAGLMVIKKIKSLYPEQKILGTAIYTVEQAILAVMSDCDYIAPYFNRILNVGSDPKKVIREIRSFIDLSKSNCKIVAASFKTKEQVIDAFITGAHTCTISKDIFDDIMNNDNVDKAVEKFNLDGFNSNMY